MLHQSFYKFFNFTFVPQFDSIKAQERIKFYYQDMLLHHGKYYPTKSFLLNSGLKVSISLK